jgi:hypothetical protein
MEKAYLNLESVNNKYIKEVHVPTISPFLKPSPSAYCGSISTVSKASEEVELKWAKDEADTMPVHPTYAWSFFLSNSGDGVVAVRRTATCCGR